MMRARATNRKGRGGGALWRASLYGLVLLVTSLVLVPAADRAGGQSLPAIGIDADPAGNTGTSLGPIDACRRVEGVEPFAVDIFVRDVPNIDGIQVTLAYNAAILRPLGQEVHLFLASSAGSNVLDFSTPATGATGEYIAAAFDFGQNASEAGTGAAIRIQFEALQRGVSTLAVRGVIVITADGSPMQPADAAGFYTGSLASAAVGVDTACQPPPTSPPTGSSTETGPAGPARSPSPGALATPVAPGTTPQGSVTPPDRDQTPSAGSPGPNALGADEEFRRDNTFPLGVWLAIGLGGPILLGLAAMFAAGYIRRLGQRGNGD